MGALRVGIFEGVLEQTGFNGKAWVKGITLVIVAGTVETGQYGAGLPTCLGMVVVVAPLRSP